MKNVISTDCRESETFQQWKFDEEVSEFDQITILN